MAAVSGTRSRLFLPIADPEEFPIQDAKSVRQGLLAALSHEDPDRVSC